jgi:hypothetical protein
MICAHDFEKIKTWPILINRPGGSPWASGTLNDLSEDLLDYHLDVKKLIQQHKRKKVKFRLKISQGPAQPLFTYIPSFAPSDYSGGDIGSGNQHFSVSALDGSFVNGNINGAGGLKTWVVDWAPAGGTPVHHETGTFTIPNSVLDTGMEVLNALYDIEIVRLNYIAFLDADVVKKEDSPALTNLVVAIDTVSGIGSITNSIIRPTDIAAPSPEFFTESSSPIDLTIDEKTLHVPAGLFLTKGLRIRIASKDDGSIWAEGEITRYNDDGNDEFKKARAQIVNNLRIVATHGGDLLRSTDEMTVVPTIQRTFPSGGTHPDFRMEEFKDELSERIHISGYGDYDTIAGFGGGPYSGAPYWGSGSPGNIWTNAGHVPAPSTSFSGFTQVAATSFGLKIGYGRRTRAGAGPQVLAMTAGTLEYTD